MTQPDMLWRHIVINTRGTWLHGDARGFRSRGHHINSSGDYRNPPCKGEHGGLHIHQLRQSREEVKIERELRSSIGQALLASLLDRHYRVLALAVGNVHSHGLVELPESLRTVKAIVGDAKRVSSRSVKKQIPGRIWATCGTFVIVKNAGHLRKANDYILYDQGPDARTWSFRDRSREGRFARKRSASRSEATRRTALPRHVGG